ncbi:hypothetical protein F5Y06DRAFT_301895 [Hypoxylon sp. FL0890]|nr:hypothetical protein F5Y06DRAFT_301895 [Hypoxylon sp. FL0890]
MESQEGIAASGQEYNQILNIPITRNNPGAWTNVLRRALEFVKSRTECYKHTHEKYDHGAQNYLDDYQMPVFDERKEELYLHWCDLLKSGKWEDEWKPRNEWGLAIHGARQRTDYNTLAKLRTRPSRGFRLLDLPVEIFMRIFEYAAGGSCELQANVVRLRHHNFPHNDSTQLIFYQPRLWAHLNVFQVCRAFRNLAIEYYGVPRQDSIPFSPKLDTVVVHGEQLDHFGYDDAVDGVAFGPNLWLQDWKNKDHWLLHDGVLSFNYLPRDVRPWSTPTVVSADFLQRPRKITMAIDDGTIYGWCWEQVWRFLGQTFVNTRCLKLDICHMDTCGTTQEQNRTEGWSELGETVRGYYKAHDIYVLFGLSSVMCDSYLGKGFLKLEVLEIESVADCCSRSWASRKHEGPSNKLGLRFVRL